MQNTNETIEKLTEQKKALDAKLRKLKREATERERIEREKRERDELIALRDWAKSRIANNESNTSIYDLYLRESTNTANEGEQG